VSGSPQAALGELFRFLIAGCSSAVGHYGVLIGLIEGAIAGPVAASVAGATVGAVINYLVNHRFTFRSTARHIQSVPRFGVVAGTGLLLNALLMWIGTALLGAHYLLAQVITTGVVFFWSFAANRLWTFRAASGDIAPGTGR
jgi:putative flippase GtrA